MVGALPTGLPPVSAPSLTPLLSGQLWASAALLALVGMTETSSISRFVARRTGQRSDPGREAVGQGLANLAWRSWEATQSARAFPARASTSREARVARVRSISSLLWRCWWRCPWGRCSPTCPGSRSPRSSSWRSPPSRPQAPAGSVPRGQARRPGRAHHVHVTLLVGPERGILAGVAAACWPTSGGRGACRSTSVCGGRRVRPSPGGPA